MAGDIVTGSLSPDNGYGRDHKAKIRNGSGEIHEVQILTCTGLEEVREAKRWIRIAVVALAAVLALVSTVLMTTRAWTADAISESVAAKSIASQVQIEAAVRQESLLLQLISVQKQIDRLESKVDNISDRISGSAN